MEIAGAKFGNISIGSAVQSQGPSLAVLQRQYQTAMVRTRESTRTVLQQVQDLKSELADLEKVGRNARLLRTGDSGVASVQGDVLSLSTAATASTLRSSAALHTSETIDPDEALSADPLEAGTVSDGSFLLNGESITVSTTDSLNDVLNRINASGAGVVATLEDSRVVLTQTTLGEVDIVLSEDTSGLVAALRLDDALTELGEVDERAVALGGVDAFAGVSAGSVALNGISISVDPATDSLSDVLDRINSAGAGVVASFSSEEGVTLRGTTAAALSLSGDSSGFLAAIGVEEGETAAEAEVVTRGSRQAAHKLASAVVALMEPLNALFAADAVLDEDVRIERIGVQSKIRAAIRTAFGDRDITADQNDLGLEFNLDTDAEAGTPLLEMRLSDVRKLETAMRNDPRELKRLLFGSNQTLGLIGQLAEAADAAIADLEISLQASGAQLGLYA